MLGSRNRRRTRALVALLAGSALVATAGCSSDEPEAKPTSTAPAGPTILTVSVYGPAPVVTAYAKIAATFSAQHQGVVVNVRPYDDAASARTALDAQLAAGNPPDAFLVPLEGIPSLQAADAIRPVDDLLGEREVDFGDGFNRYTLEAFSDDNRLQCMPVDASPLVVYYNTDLVDLAKAADPGTSPVDAETGWNMSEFATAARNASGRGSRGVYVAPSMDQVAPFIWSGGGEVVDDANDPTTLTLADGSSENGLEKLLEVVRDPQVTFNAQQLARRSALARFKGGSLAMMLGYRSLTPVLRAQQNLHFDVMPLPRVGKRATAGESSGLCIAQKTEHVDEAADFLAYAVSDDAGTVLAETGYTVPTNLDVANSDAFRQPGQQPLSADVFPANVRYIRQLPMVDTWTSVATRMRPLLTGLFNDPVIDPLDERLKAIDAASVPLFTPIPSPTPTPTGSPTGSPSGTPTR